MRAFDQMHGAARHKPQEKPNVLSFGLVQAWAEQKLEEFGGPSRAT